MKRAEPRWSRRTASAVAARAAAGGRGCVVTHGALIGRSSVAEAHVALEALRHRLAGASGEEDLAGEGAPDEPDQTRTFEVIANSNPYLFAAGPDISPDGTITFTATPGMVGTALITVVLRDNGGTVLNGVDTSTPHTFLITVTGVDTPATVRSYSLHAVGILPFGKSGWELFGQLGIGSVNIDVGGFGDEDNTVGSAGLGVSFYPTPHLAISLQTDAYAWEEEDFLDRNYDLAVGATQLGVHYIF